MKKAGVLMLIMSCFLLGSCIEIIDDLSFNLDGSGTFKYSVNLSSSKVKINSILALDTLDGKAIPSIDEIQQKIVQFREELEKQKGVEHVTVSSDFTNYLFKLECDFDNITELQKGIITVIGNLTKKDINSNSEEHWLKWDDKSLSRSIPEITLEKTRQWKPEDVALLKEGSYTSITRFKTTIDRFENANALLSKNKMAVMIKTDPHSLLHNTSLLENTIYLNDQAE